MRQRLLFDLHPVERAVLGFSLVELQYVADGLREMSLAVEMLPINLRCVGLYLLYKAYFFLGLKDYYKAVWRELDKGDVVFLVNLLENRRKNMLMISKGDTLSPKPAYIDLKPTYKSRFIISHKIFSGSVARIKLNEKVDSSVRTIFNLIMGLMPISCFGEFYLIKQHVIELELKWIGLLLEPGISDLPDYLTKNVSLGDLEMFVVLKTVLSYSYFYEEQYAEACNGFLWLSLFLSRLQKEKPGSLKRIGIASTQLRSISLYFSMSFINKNKRPNSVDDVDQCLTSIVKKSGDLDVHKEHHEGSLDFYFQVIGLLYLDKAFAHISTSLGFDFDSIEEMIRKYIIASTLKFQDDPSLPNVYDAILNGLVLYGGVNIRVLWFFNFVKDFVTLHQCVQQGLEENRLCSSTLSGQVSESLEPLLVKLMESEKLMSNDIRQLMIVSPERKQFQCPFLRVSYESKLETLELEDEDINFAEAQERMIKSNEFVELWIDSYNNYQGNIHSVIKRYLQHLDL